jgi:hypothetical protein
VKKATEDPAASIAQAIAEAQRTPKQQIRKIDW